MKLRVFLAAVGLIVVAVAGACGGGDDDGDDGNGTPGPSAPVDLSEDEQAYYEALAVVNADANEEIAAAAQIRVDALAPESDEERESKLEEFAAANVAAMENRATAISELTPPETLQSSHDQLIAAANDAVGLAGEMAAAIEADPPATEAEYAALAHDQDAATVTSRFRDACTVLQLKAGGAAADVDLGCTT